MRYAFGPFVLDTSTLELLREGEPVSIEPQVFELLAHLIENRDRVLSKDDLIASVWGGRIVSDAAISSRIKLVRRAVDDDGTRQAVIRTVHGKGFRFVADLKDEAAKPAPAPAPPPIVAEPPPVQERGRSRLLAPLGLAAIAAIGLVLLAQLFMGSRSAPDTRIAVLPVSNETGDASLDWTELGLMSLMAHELETRTDLSLVRDSTLVTLAERFPDGDPATLAPDARMLTALQDGYSASHILISRLTGTPDNLSLEYRMINPRGESAPASVSGLVAVDLAKEVSRQVAASLPRSGERRLDIPSDKFDDEYLAETFARGLDLQLQGKGTESADLFRVAVAQAPDNLELQYELAVSTRMSGDLDAAEAQFRSILEAAEAADTVQMQGAALNGLGVVQMTRRDDEAALATFRDALALAQSSDMTERRAQILTNIGIVARRLGQLEEAEAALSRAVIEFQSVGYDLPPGGLLNTMANLKSQMRDIPTAIDYYEQALRYHRLVGDQRSEAVTLHNLGNAAMSMAEHDKAAALLNEALVLRTELKDLRGQMSSLSALAELAINAGDSETAIAHADKMVRLAIDADDQYQFARAHGLAAHIDFVRADWTAAMEHSEAAEAAYEAMSRTRQAYRERIRQAVIAAYSGDTSGQGSVEEVLVWALEEDQKGTQLHAYEALTVLALLNTDASAAAEQIDHAMRLVGELRLKAATGRIAARQGLIRLLQGDAEAAKTSLGRAIIDNPDHQETVFLDGLLKVRAGETDAGAARIAEAREIAGDTWHLTERLFHALGEGS